MLNPYDYFDIVLGLVFTILFAVLFYRLGEIEYEKGYLTALASVAVSTIVLFVLRRGYIGILSGHVLLFGVFWVINIVRNKPRVIRRP